MLQIYRILKKYYFSNNHLFDCTVIFRIPTYLLAASRILLPFLINQMVHSVTHQNLYAFYVYFKYVSQGYFIKISHQQIAYRHDSFKLIRHTGRIHAVSSLRLYTCTMTTIVSFYFCDGDQSVCEQVITTETVANRGIPQNNNGLELNKKILRGFPCSY